MSRGKGILTFSNSATCPRYFLGRNKGMILQEEHFNAIWPVYRKCLRFLIRASVSG